jgi:hypothetical protein
MAGQPESDEAGREAIAAHLREGEELLWVGRPKAGLLVETHPVWVLLVLWSGAMALVSGVAVANAMRALPTWLGVLLAWPVWLLLVLFARRGRRRKAWLAVTSRRMISMGMARRVEARSFDLGGTEQVRFRAGRDGSGAVRLPGLWPPFVALVADVHAVEQAVEHARDRARASPGREGPAADGGLGEAAAGPLGVLLGRGERVLWAGRPGRTPVETRAALVFCLAAALVLVPTLALTERVPSGYHAWATAIGAVGLCLLAAAAFVWRARQGTWWVVSSERVLGSAGPGRRRVSWADVRSVECLWLAAESSGRWRVSLRAGLPSPRGIDAENRRGALGAPVRLAFARGGRDATDFYDALGDARRMALRREGRPDRGVAQALWAGPGQPRILRSCVEVLAFVAASLVFVWVASYAVNLARPVLRVRGARYLAPLWGSMALSAALSGLAWWLASLPPGRGLQCHVVTTDRVVTVRGLFDPVFTSLDRDSISAARAGWPGERRGPPIPGSRPGRQAWAEGSDGAVEARESEPTGRTGRAQGLTGCPRAGGGLAALLRPGERLLWADRACRPSLTRPRWVAFLGGAAGGIAGVYTTAAAGLAPSWLPPGAGAGAAAGAILCRAASALWPADAWYALTPHRVLVRRGLPVAWTRWLALAAARDLTVVERVDGVGDVTLVDGSRDERVGALRGLARWVVGPRRLVLHGLPQAAEAFKLIQWARAEALQERHDEEGHGEAAGER